MLESSLAPNAAAALAPVRRHFVEIRDGQVHYRAAGVDHPAKPPLICLHQSPQSSLTYQEFLPHVGRARRAIAMDTPGFGESFRPTRKPSLADYADWLVESVRALGYDRFDVLGIFTGAGIAADMAMRFPAEVRRVVLLAPPYFTQARPNTQPWPAPPRADGSHLTEAWNKVMFSHLHGDDIPFARRNDSFNELWRGGAHAIWGEEAVTAYPLKDTLPKVHQPTLVVHPDFVMADVDLAAKALPNARVARLEGIRGHTMLQVIPDRLATIIDGFLSE